MTSKPKRGRCLLCREIGQPLPKSSTNNFSDFNAFERHEVYSSWAKGCIHSVCRLLRIPKSHPFRHFFLNASYCQDCMQLIRDIDFTLKQLNNFQKQILGFRHDLFTKFGVNYGAIPNKDALSERKHDVEDSKSPTTKRRFSFDEVVKMVFEKIDGESESWTGTDFLEVESDSFRRIGIRNILEYVELEDSDEDRKSNSFYKQEDPGARSLRKRGNVSYKESDGKHEEEGTVVNKKPVPAGYNDTKNVDIPEDMDLQEDNDPEWRCSDAESLGSGDENIGGDLGSIEFGRPRTIRNDTIHERKQYYCNDTSCARGFYSQPSMLAHQRKVHEGDPKPYHCELCEVKYRYQASLTAHMKRHAAGETVVCSECGKTLTSDINLKLHMSRVHASKWKCKFCSMEFENEEKLDEHVHSHKSSDQPFKCTICNAAFTNSTTLKQHMPSHTDSSSMCEVCGKRFVTSASLKVHRKIHEESYIGHECTVCGHKFQSAGALAHHMFKHSDEKKFICEVCGAAFKYNSGLKLHKRKHDGNFPFVCQICGKGFIGAHYLKNHEETHAGYLAYECDTCHKRFRAANNLRQHVKIHEPKNPNKKKRVRIQPNFNINVPDSQCSSDQGNPGNLLKIKGSKAHNGRQFKEKRRQDASSSECESHTETEDCVETEKTSWMNYQVRNRQQEQIRNHSTVSYIAQDGCYDSQSQEHLQQAYYSIPNLTSVPVASVPIRNVPGPPNYLSDASSYVGHR